MVSAVLALDPILTDTKKEGGHIPMQTETEGAVFRTRSQMQRWGAR